MYLFSTPQRNRSRSGDFHQTFTPATVLGATAPALHQQRVVPACFAHTPRVALWRYSNRLQQTPVLPFHTTQTGADMFVFTPHGTTTVGHSANVGTPLGLLPTVQWFQQTPAAGAVPTQLRVGFKKVKK